MSTGSKDARAGVHSRRRSCLGCLGKGALLAVALLVVLVSWANWQLARSETRASVDGAPGLFATIDGRISHYQRLGVAAPGELPVLLLHGFSVAGGAEWGPLSEHLVGSRELIIPDMLGFGHAERVEAAGQWYSVAGRARALLALLDQLGIAQVDVVGASYGGGVAAELAFLAPERVRRLVLIDAQAEQHGGGGFSFLGGLPLGVGRAVTWASLGAGPGGQALARLECGSGGYCPDQAALELRARLASIAGTTDSLRAMNATPPEAHSAGQLASIAQPALILWGANDAIIPLERGRRLDDLLPNATLMVLDGHGHVPHLQSPARVAELIEQWLAAP